MRSKAEIQSQLDRNQNELRSTIRTYCDQIGCKDCPLYEDGSSCHATQLQEIEFRLERELRTTQESKT